MFVSLFSIKIQPMFFLFLILISNFRPKVVCSQKWPINSEVGVAKLFIQILVRFISRIYIQPQIVSNFKEQLVNIKTIQHNSTKLSFFLFVFIVITTKVIYYLVLKEVEIILHRKHMQPVPQKCKSFLHLPEFKRSYIWRISAWSQRSFPNCV